MYSIPPLLPPEQSPPITTVEVLHRQWRALMGRLGFGERSLWVLQIDPQGIPLRQLYRVEDLSVKADLTLIRNLIRALALAETDMPWTVAFLLTRPGGVEQHFIDRAWATALLREAARAGVAIWPVFAATDHSLHMVEPPQAA